MSSKRSYLPTSEEIQSKPGELSQMTRQAMELANWERIDIKDADQIEERCKEYFSYCIERDIRPFVEGLCLALGTNRQSLVNWEHEKSRRGDCIRKSKQTIKALLERWGLENRLNPATLIFLYKNIAGYKDVVTLEPQQTQSSMADKSPEDIKKQLLDDLPIDSDYKEI